MPLEIRITQEEILKAALKLIREEGAAGLTARKIAAVLNCSTQPVYSTFKNMKTLEQKVIEEAMHYVMDKYLMPKSDDMPYFSTGLGFLEIARKEPQLFTFLFKSGRVPVDVEDVTWPFSDPNLRKKVLQDELLKGLDDDVIRKIFRYMWIYTLGLTMLMHAKPEALTDGFFHESLYEMGAMVLNSAHRGQLKDMKNREQ